jgi:KDO2-lipid IV(A) lauroyltransferase
MNTQKLETGLSKILVGAMRLLPPATASNLAGGVARAIGPMLPVSQVADANLRAALPALSAPERRKIVRGVWEQLGRTMGELPNIGRLRRDTPSGPGWWIDSRIDLAEIARRGGPAIFFTGHIGNWEMLPRAADALGMRCASIYRAAQNRQVDALVLKLRREASGFEQQFFNKGATGARQALRHLSQGGYLGMLVDQKMNDGIEARFFGRPAMTAPALAAFALKFQCPVIPVLVVREGPARLRIQIEEPLVLPATGHRQSDILALTQQVNDVLEGWIRKRPESWLWLHRRWPRTPEDS